MTPQVPAQWPEGGPQHVSIALVGEAPGAEEVTHKAPFMGPSGRLLNAALRLANLDRSQMLVTNVFDAKAPDNDVVPWMQDEGRRTEAFERLAGELAQATPDLIVPLGGTALWALTNDKNIMSLRGYVMKASRVREGAKLVPTLHPAAVLKAYKFLPVVVGDLARAGREAERGPEVLLPRRKLMLEPTLPELRTVLRRWHETADILSVDIETGWGQITSIAFAPDEETAICIPFVDRRRPNRSYWPNEKQELEAWKEVRELLASPIPKLGQNFTYDAYWLLALKGIEVRNYREDTRLLHHALYAELPKSLEFMAGSYGTQGAWKSWGGKYSKDKKDN